MDKMHLFLSERKKPLPLPLIVKRAVVGRQRRLHQSTGEKEPGHATAVGFQVGGATPTASSAAVLSFPGTRGPEV